MKSEVRKWWRDKKIRAYIILFFFVFLLIHLLIREVLGDSVNYFSHALENQNLWEYIITRYQTWSSRVFIELPLPYLSNHLKIWKVLNLGMCMLLLFGLMYLSHGKNSGLVVGLLMLYPFKEMASAGWIATCVNYLWPLALIIWSCVGLDKAYHGQKMGLIEIAVYLLCEIFATSLEQVCVLYICVLLYILAVCIIEKKYKGLRFVFIQVFIAAAQLIFILTCPGNYLRKTSNISSWMKDFGTLSIVDKAVMGMNSTVQVLANESLLFFILCVVLFICAYQENSKSKNAKWMCVVSGIPLTFVVFRTVLKPLASIYYPYINIMFDEVQKVTAGNYVNFSFYVPTVTFIIIIVMVILSLINLTDEAAKGIELAFIFITGLLTRVAMGFSPTLYASTRRTFLFLDFALIFIILRIYEYKAADMEENSKVKVFMQCGLTVFAVFSVINNIIAAC